MITMFWIENEIDLREMNGNSLGWNILTVNAFGAVMKCLFLKEVFDSSHYVIIEKWRDINITISMVEVSIMQD